MKNKKIYFKLALAVLLGLVVSLVIIVCLEWFLSFNGVFKLELLLLVGLIIGAISLRGMRQ